MGFWTTTLHFFRGGGGVAGTSATVTFVGMLAVTIDRASVSNVVDFLRAQGCTSAVLSVDSNGKLQLNGLNDLGAPVSSSVANGSVPTAGRAKIPLLTLRRILDSAPVGSVTITVTPPANTSQRGLAQLQYVVGGGPTVLYATEDVGILDTTRDAP